MIVDCLWESEGASRLNIHPSAPGSVSLLHAAAVLRDIDVAFCRMNYFGDKCTQKIGQVWLNTFIGRTGVLEIWQMTY